MTKTAQEVRDLVANLQTGIEAIEGLNLQPQQLQVVAAHHAVLAEGAAELAARWSDLFPDDDDGLYVGSTVASRSTGGPKEPENP